jgi:hypothetical protein
MDDADKAKVIFDRLERKYKAEGLRPVRWTPPSQVGCRGCGDTKKGPWTVNVMSSKVPERGEALLFVAVLCGKCQGNEDLRDQAAENVVSAYLRSQNP